MTEALEDKLIDLRERIDALLANQKAYRRKHVKAKQFKQQSTTEKMQSAAPLNLRQYQVKHREQNFTKRRRIGMKQYVALIGIAGAVLSALYWSGNFIGYLDLPSFVLVVGVGFFNALSAKDGESVITRFGDGCVRAGWIGFMIGVLAFCIMNRDATEIDLAQFVMVMSFAILTPFYGYFLKIISMQLE